VSGVEAMLEALVGREGGYVDHPSDRGGATMWGVTEAVARAHGYRGAMRAMPRAVALAIYRARYWRAPGFDAIEAIDAPVAERLLDIGVNMGPVVAGRMLQRLLNALNGRGGLYADLAVDGACGVMTRAAMMALIERRGPRARQVLLHGLRALQATRYLEIAEGDPRQEDFAWGWLSARAFAA